MLLVDNFLACEWISKLTQNSIAKVNDKGEVRPTELLVEQENSLVIKYSHKLNQIDYESDFVNGHFAIYVG